MPSRELWAGRSAMIALFLVGCGWTGDGSRVVAVTDQGLAGSLGSVLGQSLANARPAFSGDLGVRRRNHFVFWDGGLLLRREIRCGGALVLCVTCVCAAGLRSAGLEDTTAPRGRMSSVVLGATAAGSIGGVKMDEAGRDRAGWMLAGGPRRRGGGRAMEGLRG